VGRIKTLNSNIVKKRVLVTGATGFIGTHLTHRLKELTNRLTATNFDDSPSGLEQGFEWKNLDITDANAVQEIIKEVRPQIVFHLGAILGSERTYEFAEQCLITNVIGTHNLLRALGTHNPELERIILMGSSEEYGNGKDIPFTEDQPPQPVSPYSASKAAATQFALLYQELFQLPVVILRPFIVFGPGQSHKMMIPELIKYGIEGKDFPMTKGEQTRDFLYIDDLIDGLLLAAASPNAAGEIINICSGVERSIREAAELIHRLLNAKMKLLIGAFPYRKNEVWRLYGSNEKAKQLLGWRPKISFEDGIIKTISWYSTQLEGKFI
jgi:UDP-glucose 4-epimerase